MANARAGVAGTVDDWRVTGVDADPAVVVSTLDNGGAAIASPPADENTPEGWDPPDGHLDGPLHRIRERLKGMTPTYRRCVWTEDRKFLERCLTKVPRGYRGYVVDEYIHHFQREGRRTANLYLLRAAEVCDQCRGWLNATDDALRAKAHGAARVCHRAVARWGLEFGRRTCRSYGIEPPAGAGLTPDGIAARLRDPTWWLRRLRRALGRQVEWAARVLNLVGGRRGRYVSEAGLNFRRERQRHNAAVLAGLVAVNDLGQEYGLEELIALSVANPKLRRNELMVRMAGSELYAWRHGCIAMFYTLTCPGRMHRAYQRSGDPVPTWDGTTVKESHQHLQRLWSRIRAAYGRRGIQPFGFRIAEPHHDGTVHYHLLLFVRPDEEPTLTGLLRRYALQDDPDEPGAQERRLEVVRIDWTRGTATGYAAKYVAKNTDGAHLDGEGEASNAERARAWASIHGIRQFEPIGGVPVSVYRELRRLPAERADSTVEPLRAAADAGDWCALLEAVGGPHVRRRDYPVQLWRPWDDRPGKYGEPRGYSISGLQAGSVVYPTRIRTWEIQAKPAPGGEAAGPWSSVNNCTQFLWTTSRVLDPQSFMQLSRGAQLPAYIRRACISTNLCYTEMKVYAKQGRLKWTRPPLPPL